MINLLKNIMASKKLVEKKVEKVKTEKKMVKVEHGWLDPEAEIVVKKNK
jgi:hypothetical protein